MRHVTSSVKAVVSYDALAKYLRSKAGRRHTSLDIEVDVLDASSHSGGLSLVEGGCTIRIPAIRDDRALDIILAALSEEP